MYKAVSKPQTLAEFFGTDEVEFNVQNQEDILRSTAHLIIDAQRYFADPDYLHNPEHADDPSYPQGGGDAGTDAVSEHIATLVPQFKNSGLNTGWVFFRNRPHENEDTYGGFYKVQPDRKTDFFAGKSTASPFEDRLEHYDENSPFKAMLEEKGIKNLIVSGFNTSGCVYKTVLDALHADFNVCVLTDMTENGGGGDPKLEEKLAHMQEEGAILTDSNSVLETLHSLG